MRRRDSEFTMVATGLTRQQATDIKQTLIEKKERYAPNAKAGIAIGERTNFISVMGSCIKLLGK